MTLKLNFEKYMERNKGILKEYENEVTIFVIRIKTEKH